MTGDDEQAFTALFEQCYDDVLRYATRRTASTSDAGDVAAETFVVAWRRRDKLPSGEARRPWLFGVARNVLANQARSQARLGRLRTRLAAEPQRAATATELHSDGGPVATAFARLAQRDREILALVAWEGLQNDEIAVTLGITPAAVRVRLHRARRRFTAALGQQPDAEDDRWAPQALLAGETA